MCGRVCIWNSSHTTECRTFLSSIGVVFHINSANWFHRDSSLVTALTGCRRPNQNLLLHPVGREFISLFASMLLLVSQVVGERKRLYLCLIKYVCVFVLQVIILRGKDGYGFTICSDSPVRVQAVDPGEFACTHQPPGICLSRERLLWGLSCRRSEKPLKTKQAYFNFSWVLLISTSCTSTNTQNPTVLNLKVDKNKIALATIHFHSEGF